MARFQHAIDISPLKLPMMCILHFDDNTVTPMGPVNLLKSTLR